MRSIRLLLLLMMLSTAAFAQSDAQKTFEKIKALSGTWEGKATMDMPVPEAAEHSVMHVMLRTTSRGNAVMHEMTSAGPEDPVTMFYLDEGRFLLTHYCDAGNSLRQHMHHAKFTFIDANHHTEDWTFMLGDKEVHGHVDLHRTADAGGAPGK